MVKLSEKRREVAQLCLTLCDPMDCSLPGSAVHGISRQGYWNGLPFPSPGNLPNPRIEPGSPTLQADTLPSEPPGKSVFEIAPKYYILDSFVDYEGYSISFKGFLPTVVDNGYLS